MDAIEMLRDFARSQGIKSSEVDKFLKKFNEPKTLQDVMNLPRDLQVHEKYITWLDEPLQSFISDKMYDGQRYETVKVDEVVDRLYDKIYDLVDEDNSFDADDVFEEGFDIESLGLDKEKEDKLQEYIDVGRCIIDIKFGSVVMDW